MQEESPEGGRFKKEAMLDGQSYLLLIRDEGGPPDLQFASWFDALVFVFSLEDEGSFQTALAYYQRLETYRDLSNVPVLLVGTQDAISESNPRVIDDARARRLAFEMRRCAYFETCATYGLNVDRVFQDGTFQTRNIKQRSAACSLEVSLNRRFNLPLLYRKCTPELDS